MPSRSGHQIAYSCNKAVSQPCFVWPGTLYRRPVTSLPHKTSCSPGWQKRSGYTRRALVEATISRLKRVIGDALRSRTDRRRATEVAVAVQALNRMLEFGRPKSVRIA